MTIYSAFNLPSNSASFPSNIFDGVLPFKSAPNLNLGGDKPTNTNFFQDLGNNAPKGGKPKGKLGTILMAGALLFGVGKAIYSLGKQNGFWGTETTTLPENKISKPLNPTIPFIEPNEGNLVVKINNSENPDTNPDEDDCFKQILDCLNGALSNSSYSFNNIDAAINVIKSYALSKDFPSPVVAISSAICSLLDDCGLSDDCIIKFIERFENNHPEYKGKFNKREIIDCINAPSVEDNFDDDDIF